MHLLAQALGVIASASRGLSKIVLPRSLPSDFRHELAQAVRENGGEAIIVGDQLDKGEFTPQQAISFRTPETGGVSAVILITTEGFSKDLKSLETFRDMLFQGLPGASSKVALHSLRSTKYARKYRDVPSHWRRQQYRKSGCRPKSSPYQDTWRRFIPRLGMTQFHGLAPIGSTST